LLRFLEPIMIRLPSVSVSSTPSLPLTLEDMRSTDA
jgi:hypothetical protein